jgi:hypothetical protein
MFSWIKQNQIHRTFTSKILVRAVELTALTGIFDRIFDKDSA